MSFKYTFYNSVVGRNTLAVTEGGHVQKIWGLDESKWMDLSLYLFTSFTFTSAALRGRTGPTLSQLLSSYNTSTYPWLTSTLFFDMTDNGIQEWTVPLTGVYTISAQGATGGVAYDGTTRVGRGGIVSGDFSFTTGDVLKIVVGQQGRPINTSNPDGPSSGTCYNSGGGGGSFVFYQLSDSLPLIVGGGGGGGSYGGQSSYRPDADGSLSGNPGTGVTNNGQTLYSGLLGGQTLGYGGINTTYTAYKAGGGSGWLGSGLGGHTNCSTQSPYHIQGGWYKNKTLDTGSNTSNGGPFMGGAGGNYQGGNGSERGGFGGGGGGTGRCGSCQAGGGGGYTGGGIQNSNNSYPTMESLAGGGNYVNAVASNPSFDGYNGTLGPGSVTITAI